MLPLFLWMFPRHGSALPTIPSGRNGFLPANQSFEFNVNCGNLAAETCDAMKADLDTLGGLIAEELYFKVPVSVCVEAVDVYTDGPDTNGNVAETQIANGSVSKMFSKYY